jgi:hypothetical protein
MQDKIRNVGARGDRTVETLVTDYISALGEHLMHTLRQKLGDPVVKNAEMEFVVTVPAIWSDLAKERTRRACQLARHLPSSRPIHMVSEPEAAAIYALHGLDPHGLKADDCFLVCDAGGGTVDLIAYTITKLKPVLEVEEATAGTGGLCGSSFLNRRFIAFLKGKIGHLDGFDDELLAEAVDKFEKTVRHGSHIKLACPCSQLVLTPCSLRSRGNSPEMLDRTIHSRFLLAGCKTTQHWVFAGVVSPSRHRIFTQSLSL